MDGDCKASTSVDTGSVENGVKTIKEESHPSASDKDPIASTSKTEPIENPKKRPSEAMSTSPPTFQKPFVDRVKNTLFNYFKRSPEKKITKVDSEPKSTKIKRKKDRYASRHLKDTMEYRKGYPNRQSRDDVNKQDNVMFYTNKIPSKPRGDYIDVILKEWLGNYDLLESHHGYIQWLFPTRESGINSLSQELQLHEAQKIGSDPEAQARLIKAYRLMLDFYGMRLKDEATGEIDRAENWNERFTNLNENQHNFLRITRMLKSLGELGLEPMKAAFLRFVLREALEERTLLPTLDAALDYWLCTIKDDQQRADLLQYARQFVEDV